MASPHVQSVNLYQFVDMPNVALAGEAVHIEEILRHVEPYKFLFVAVNLGLPRQCANVDLDAASVSEVVRKILRKSDMPLSVDTPAPPKNTTRRLPAMILLSFSSISPPQIAVCTLRGRA
jgi:hypothetical protein